VPSGQILVDTLGLPISIGVTSADTHDKIGAWRLLAGLKPLVGRDPEAQGFAVQPRR
jgi:hypothetical protein